MPLGAPKNRGTVNAKVSTKGERKTKGPLPGSKRNNENQPKTKLLDAKMSSALKRRKLQERK